MTTDTSKSWVFTLNNPTDDERKFFENIEVNKIVVGLEEGESGTPHLQGFITFKRSYRITGLKKLSPRAHWEKAKTADAANYCMKEHIIINRGFEEKKKKKTSEIIVEYVDAGKSDMEIIETTNSAIFHERAIDYYRRVKYNSIKHEPPVVHWYYGASGLGKTRAVRDKHDDTELCFITIEDHRFFTGYEPDKRAVLFDDLRPGDLQFHHLMRVLDRYSGVRVPIKGSSLPWVPKDIYITSNVHPREFAIHVGEEILQITRRISEIKEFT